MWNMEKTGLIQKKFSRKVVVSKASRNVWSECADANFYMTFVVCVSDAKYVALPLLIHRVNRLNSDVLEGFNIEGANITTAPKCFTNYNLFLSWIELF